MVEMERSKEGKVVAKDRASSRQQQQTEKRRVKRSFFNDEERAGDRKDQKLERGADANH